MNLPHTTQTTAIPSLCLVILADIPQISTSLAATFDKESLDALVDERLDTVADK